MTSPCLVNIQLFYIHCYKAYFYVIMLCSIYGVHDEAKDKDFELEMSWVCDESNRQHQKVMSRFYIVFLYFELF